MARMEFCHLGTIVWIRPFEQKIAPCSSNSLHSSISFIRNEIRLAPNSTSKTSSREENCSSYYRGYFGDMHS